MIVLIIMASLTVMTTQSIQQALKSKAKILQQVDDSSQVRDSLRVFERDVNLAFHYSDYELEMRELIKKKRTAQASSTTVPGASTTTTVPGSNKGLYNPNDPSDPLNQKDENRADPVTQWIGKESELYFATMNSSRVREGEQQADFIKVAYLLKSCKSLGESNSRSSGSSSCLIRRTSPIVEGDITLGGQDVVLLQDVTEFKLRYYGKGKQDWVSDWDSKAGDAITKGRFPDAVEVSLSVEKGNTEPKKKISMQLVVPLRFANNISRDQQNADARQKAQQQQGPNNPGGNGP
jgi:hypothetical protein